MNSKLIVNGIQLDLSENIAVPLNLSISDVREPEKRKRSYSKSIKLEGTSNNMAFFLSAYSLSIDIDNSSNLSFDPSIKNPAEFYKNDLLIFKGKLKLNEVIIDNKNYYFDCTLFSDVVDIFTKLKDKKLSELDWSEYDHLLTRTNVINSWATGIQKNGSLDRNFGADSYGYQPKSYGYVYPLVDYGFNKVNTTTFRTNQLYPFIYVKEAIQKLLNEALEGENIEVDYTTNFFTNPNMTKLIYGYGGGEQLKLSDENITKSQVKFLGNTNSVTSTGMLYKENGLTWYATNKLYDLIKIYNQTSLVSNANTLNKTTGIIKINLPAYYTLSFTGLINLSNFIYVPIPNTNIPSNIFSFYVEVNGVEKYRSNINIFTIGAIPIDFKTDLLLKQGDEVKIFFRVIINNLLSNFTFNLSNLNSDLIANKSSYLTDNSPVSLNSSIPDIKCSDFFKGILNLFYAYMSDPIYDPVTNKSTIYIDSFINYYKNQSDYDNWTDYVDEKREINIQSNSLIEGSNYIYRFSEEKDFFNNEYKRIIGSNYGEKNIEFDTWQSGEVKFELPFNTYIPYKIENTSVIYPLLIDKSIDNTGKITEKPYKGKGMITFYNGLKDGVVKIRNTNDDTESNSNYYPNIHHLRFGYKNLTPVFDLHFSSRAMTFDGIQQIPSVNTFEFYHRRFLNELTSPNSKLLSLYLKLNYKDIHELDFAKLKMIDGILYRLNAIKDFDLDSYGTTQVELIKYLG